MHRRLSVVLLLVCLVFACSVCSFAKEAGHISAGDALEGANKAVYDYLSEQISQVAAGNVTQTYFMVSAEELGLDRVWTAEELGVDGLWASSSALFPDAEAALVQELGLDLEHVIDALLFDHPYELYWFNKTGQCQTGWQYSGRYGSSNDIVSFYMFSFYLPISRDYAVSVAGGWNPAQMDPSKQAKAPAALAEAKAVVAANAGKSDYEKLAAYKNYICDAVSYNDTAAETENYPYGDPWQLISVFDGDRRTDVVCEGYAKAFQLL